VPTHWLPESSSCSPLDPCTRCTTYVVAVSSLVCIFDLNNRSPSNFRRVRPALARLELSVSSRVRIGLATNSSPTGLRIPTDVSSFHLLSKTSALKLRLERFRTSHARVIGNLLLPPIGASEIRGNFVGFLLKTSLSCGGGWKRSLRPS